jgi:hypothetical protein
MISRAPRSGARRSKQENDQRAKSAMPTPHQRLSARGVRCACAPGAEKLIRGNYKSGLRLRTRGFRIQAQTPETNVQDRGPCGRRRDSPIVKLDLRISLFCHELINAAAIGRQKNLHLAIIQVDVRIVRGPFNSHHLSWPQNIPGFGRNETGSVLVRAPRQRRVRR